MNYLILDMVISPVLLVPSPREFGKQFCFILLQLYPCVDLYPLICWFGESVAVCLGEVMRFEKEMNFWNVKASNLFHCMFSFFLVNRIHKILLTKMNVWTMRYLNT